MKRQRLRIFVSSPGDVLAAREVAAQVIEKVAQDYARHFAIEPYLWEYEPMLASGHFQDAIDPPSHFDVVILILESRLGTPLPARTAVREYRGIDGRTPVTGTEWEFEDALAGARAHGIPDLLVYRSTTDARISTRDPQRRQALIEQIDALDAFWSRHFRDETSFIGGYAEYKSLEEFAAKFEQNLRRCVEKRIEALTPVERATAARLWPKAPFRGLEAYEFEHAPIFFGRDEAIGAALLRLMTNALANRPFLLLLGASGSGKSSLVKAGIVPRLFVPQRVSGAAFLRHTVFRPSEARADEDLFDALARCLTEGDSGSTGLNELLGDSMTVGDLARHLREVPAHPGFPFAIVIDRLTETARSRGRALGYEKGKFILVVDQLEELFTAERVQPEERKRFVQLLAGLVRSGLVWIIATMRADFWHRAAETPELLELTDGHGRLDVLPPTPAELSQMIRRPAEAAAISFEIHLTSGIPLNDLIAGEAAREPGALPLLSYVLDQMYQKDVEEGGGSTLTYASYNALGGLKGAIATRADAVIAAQPPEDQLALRQVLFALVQMSSNEVTLERAVARRAPLSDFPKGTAKRRLIEALLDRSARLLVAEAAGSDAATVRLAHEALVGEWRVAGDYVAANAEALKTRRTVEQHFARWRALKGDGAAHGPHATLRSPVSVLRARLGGELGLLTDVDLADAKRLLREYREELAPELVGYIERSLANDRRRRRRTLRAVTAAAVVMGVLAVGAVYEAKLADAQRDTALQAQLRSLTQTAAARLKDAEVPAALGIILEVLPHRGVRHGYTPEALSVFQEARAADTALIVITGHTGHVRSAAFSPDGQRILTASSDYTSRLWDAGTGRQLLVLKGHAANVDFAAFSPDGQRVVTASRDNTARLWDAKTGRELLVLSGHTDHVSCAAFSPDGGRIVTASRDNTARVWDAVTGQEIRVLSGHGDPVTCAAFSPDGRRVVTASRDMSARIWDIATGQQIRVLSGHTAVVASAVFSPDGLRIVTASDDETARIWDVATGREILVMSGHATGLGSAAFSPDGRRVVTASYDKTARIWDAATGREISVLNGHTSDLCSAAFSPDGRLVVTASDDGTARIWESATGREFLLLSGHKAGVESAAFSPDAQRAVTASLDKTARVWDAVTGREILLLSGHTAETTSAAFSPDGRRIVTSSDDETARLWDAITGRQILQLIGHTGWVLSAAFSPDGQRIVTASNDKTARLWDAATGREIRELKGHTAGVISAAFSPDGRRIVTGSYDNSGRIWDALTGRQILLLSGHTAPVAWVAFSPDGQRILTASADKTARLWDAATGRETVRLSGHTDVVASAVFSADGQRIATASIDRTARLWEAATGRQIMLLRHADVVQTAVFSPDGGTRILTASEDGNARIWDAHVPALDLQIGWAEAARFDPLSSTETFQLGLPAPPDVRQWPHDRTACDDSAAAPYDPDRLAPGVMVEHMVTDIAIGACAKPESRNYQSARAVYQHGRALLASGNFLLARQDFQEATASGYRAAAVDLGVLLSRPSAGMLDVPRAISLLEQAWKSGVPVAAFELGALYEYGVPSTGTKGSALTPDETQAWDWYQKAADAGEPNALARFAERDDDDALLGERAQKNTALLDSFRYYAAAAERARREDWPDDAWRNWRYRRASMARLLAREGMMEQVAEVYETVRQKYAPLQRTSFMRLTSQFGGE